MNGKALYSVKKLPEMELYSNGIHLHLHSINNPKDLKIYAFDGEEALRGLIIRHYGKRLKKDYGVFFENVMCEILQNLYKYEISVKFEHEQLDFLKLIDDD